MILLGAVSITGFWVLDRAGGFVYDDPLGYRLALSAIAIAVLGLSYVDARVRRHIRPIMVAVIYVIAAFFSWTGARNGLDANWAGGILLGSVVAGLALALFARSTREISVTLPALWLASVLPLVLTPPPPSGLSLGTAHAVALLGCTTAAITVAGIARLRTLAALAESRDQLLAERDHGEAQRRLLRTVMDSIPTPIYVNDRQGRSIMRNQASAQQLGFETPQEGLGATVFDLLPYPVAQADWDDQQRVMETGRPSLRVPHVFESAGGTIHYHADKVPLVADDEVVGLVGVLHDVTAQKEAEETLIVARDHAQAAVRAKSEFLANMSHEIRTPMNGVIGMADVLAGTPLAPDQAECVRTIQTCADALLSLISDVLDLSKIEAEGIELEAVRFEPRELVDEAAKVVRVQAESRGLALAVHVAPGVPAVALGDPGRIRQVLLNLLSNACKFTSEGGVTVEVSASSLAASGLGPFELRFAVSDTGIGIEPNKRDQLFEAFTQADASTTRKYGGTGLGLTISSQLVALMGGQIRVDGAPGVGSTFAFGVRVEALPDLRRAASAERAPGVVAPGLRVLVAEDNAVNQRVVLRLLERLGAQAEVAENGADALDALHRAARTRPYDVVLMDVQMPVLDGHQATRRLRAELPAGAQPWVIALTANAMAGDREACLDAGADDYLSKPVRYDSLCQAIADARSKPEAQPEAT